MSQWKFRRRQSGCAVCERPFAEGERHFSALGVRDGDLLREDACGGCWASRSDGGRAIWWHTRHSAQRDRRLALNIEALEALFLALEGQHDTALRELRFLLCLLLMRKRRLKTLRIARDAQGESFIVHRPRRKEELRVYVFEFTPERMGELREKLREIFEGAEPESPLGLASDPAARA
jgi:hypothetical protein